MSSIVLQHVYYKCQCFRWSDIYKLKIIYIRTSSYFWSHESWRFRNKNHITLFSPLTDICFIRMNFPASAHLPISSAHSFCYMHYGEPVLIPLPISLILEWLKKRHKFLKVFKQRSSGYERETKDCDESSRQVAS